MNEAFASYSLPVAVTLPLVHVLGPLAQLAAMIIITISNCRAQRLLKKYVAACMLLVAGVYIVKGGHTMTRAQVIAARGTWHTTAPSVLED